MPFLATVAQLVEQGFRKPQVNGSNPFGGSIISSLGLPDYVHFEKQYNIRFF
jgi:hypothetical protein